MKKLITILLIIIFQLLISNCQAQSPVDSVGSGCALEFNGVSNRVIVPDNPTLSGMNALTISSWVKLTNGSAAMFPIVAKWESTFSSGDKDTYSMLIRPTGQVAFSFHTTGSTSNWGTIYHNIWNTSYTCPFNVWVHLTVVRIGTTLKLYVNGVLQDTSNGIISSNPFVVSSKEVQIGAEVPALSTRYFPGQLDEVRIWNRALTQTEIQQNMCKKLIGTETGLVGYWRFDDCGGLTATDASGNGNNGTLN